MLHLDWSRPPEKVRGGIMRGLLQGWGSVLEILMGGVKIFPALGGHLPKRASDGGGRGYRLLQNF